MKEVLFIFCSQLGTNLQADLLEKKINGLEKGNRTVVKLKNWLPSMFLVVENLLQSAMYFIYT